MILLALALAAPATSPRVGVSFDRFRAIPASPGADMDGAFRYADLVLVARFDPACFDLCLDKASVLFDARVEKVTRRRHSRDGLIWRPDVLRDAAAAEADAVVALVRDTDKQDEGLEFRAFLTDDPEADSGVVCRKAERGGGPWPTSWEGAIVAKSTEDTYRCWRARKVNGAWRISF